MESLERVKELRILTGNLTHRDKLDQLAENYHTLEPVTRLAERFQYVK
jgi:hypothetical protein